jgi:cytochrome c-type biogenesis protein CcmH
MPLSCPVALAAAALAMALAAAATPALAATPRTTLPDVEDEVMCVECGTALNVSTSPVAEREREFIRRRIAEGKGKAEIKAALVEEYGPRVLAVPEGGGFDVAAWLVPGVLSLLALLGVGAAALRWRARRSSPARKDDGQDLKPDDARRLDADLAAFDRR